MTRHQSALSALVSELLQDPDLAHDELFRRLLQAGLQDLNDADASVKIGAGRYERTESRPTMSAWSPRSRPIEPQAVLPLMTAVTSSVGGAPTVRALA